MSELTPETTTEEKKPGRLSKYGLLLGSIVGAAYALPVITAVVTAAPLIVGAAAIGGAAYVATKPSLREKTLGFFKKVGGLYADALKQVVTDWHLATNWAETKAAEQKAKVTVASNDDGTESKLGSKTSAPDFDKAADPDAPKVKAKKPAPKPAPIHKVGM